MKLGVVKAYVLKELTEIIRSRLIITDIHAEAGESYRTVSGRTLIFFSTSFIMLKREVAVKLPAFVFVIDTLQHNRYN
jgi:hypothetical protein